MICLGAFQGFSGVLELDRHQVLAGEIWRIWTGHLVHTNPHHLALNSAAALVLYFGFFTRIKPGDLLGWGFVFTALISAGLLSVFPEIEWYNGLSGLLHAFVVYFSIRRVRDGAKTYWIGPGLVWIKVLAEAVQGALGHAGLVGDMAVITQAHLMGASMGTITAVLGVAFWPGNGFAWLPAQPGATISTKERRNV